MTPEQIDQLATDAGTKVSELIGELSPHIREAAAAVLEETQDSDSQKAPKLTISMSVVVNLGAHPPSYDVKGSVAVKRTATIEGALEDPGQAKLPL